MPRADDAEEAEKGRGGYVVRGEERQSAREIAAWGPARRRLAHLGRARRPTSARQTSSTRHALVTESAEFPGREVSIAKPFRPDWCAVCI